MACTFVTHCNNSPRAHSADIISELAGELARILSSLSFLYNYILDIYIYSSAIRPFIRLGHQAPTRCQALDKLHPTNKDVIIKNNMLVCVRACENSDSLKSTVHGWFQQPSAHVRP